MLPLAFAIALHECGHLLALRLLCGRICSFRPAPFGLCIEYDQSTLSLRGEAVVLIAGGAVNLLVVLLSVALYKLFGIDTLDFAIVNAALLMLNMLPAKPLDGGRLLEIITESLFGISLAYAVSAAVTYIFGYLVFLFASYSLLTSQSGIYPLLFSVYLFICNAKTLEKARFTEK